MNATGFWWILLAATLYGILHSLLAANRTKRLAERLFGIPATCRYYRLAFVLLAGITLLPILALVALLPDATLYVIPAPWRFLTLALQALAVLGLLASVLQTGASSFLGIRQWLEASTHKSPRPEKLVVNGMYRWVRHPLYTFSLIFLWLTPVMTWNLLALTLAFSLYMLLGAYFLEEPKLVEQFGQEYESYRRRTPMIVPGLNIKGK